MNAHIQDLMGAGMMVSFASCESTHHPINVLVMNRTGKQTIPCPFI
ncbi:MAG: hypothetical protein ACI9BG_001442 [Parasphingorhabdus sp.]